MALASGPFESFVKEPIRHENTKTRKFGLVSCFRDFVADVQVADVQVALTVH